MINNNKIQNILLNFCAILSKAFRLLVKVGGKIVKYVDPHIGLLHRGRENMILFFYLYSISLPLFLICYWCTVCNGFIYCVIGYCMPYSFYFIVVIILLFRLRKFFYFSR